MLLEYLSPYYVLKILNVSAAEGQFRLPLVIFAIDA